MKTGRPVTMMAASALLLIAMFAHAQVPPIINYQGQLLDGSGNPANGSFTMVFSIFDAVAGGTALYTETQSITVSNGLFNALIGSVTPIPQTLFDDAPRFLEITANGTVLTPRRPFGSVPYAFNAGNGDSSPWQTSGNDVYYKGGNVGIGTDDPKARVHSLSTGDIPSFLASGSSADFAVPDSQAMQFGHWDGSSIFTERMRIGREGYLGVGTTNPNAVVHSQSSGSVPSFFATGSGADYAVPDNQAMQFGSWDGSSVFTEWMRIGSAGNVGIGTTNPGRFSGAAKYLTVSASDYYLADRMAALELVGSSINTTIPVARLDFGSVVSQETVYDIARIHAETGPSASEGELVFSTRSGSSLNERMRINPNGFVGVGTTSPGIFSGASKYLTISASDLPVADKVAALELQGSTLTTDSPIARIDFSSVGSSGPNNIARIRVETSPLPDLGKLEFFTHDGTSLKERLTITHTGFVGIGDSSPSYPIDMASGAHVTAGGVWTDASSRAYKENIHALSVEAALSAFEALTPVEFNYKVDRDETCLGFIAEDVPDLVATKDRKSLSAMDIVAMLTKVVQHQQEQITELQDRIEAMEK